MDGVRRFLAAASSPSSSSPIEAPPASAVTPVFNPRNGPSWPPEPDPVSPPQTTAPLFSKKDRQKFRPNVPGPGDEPGNTSTQSGRSSNGVAMSPSRSVNSLSTPASPIMPSSSRPLPQTKMLPKKTINGGDMHAKRSSVLNTRDELLISLLASEAVVDSRDFDILTSEEVEDLKKVWPKFITNFLNAQCSQSGTPSPCRSAWGHG